MLDFQGHIREYKKIVWKKSQSIFHIAHLSIHIHQFKRWPFLFFLWRCGPTWSMTSSFLRFLDHTRRTTVDRTPLDEWSARRRDLYLTTHNTHNRQTSMPTVGFEPTISAGERPQTYNLDRAATGTGEKVTLNNKNKLIVITLDRGNRIYGFPIDISTWRSPKYKFPRIRKIWLNWGEIKLRSAQHMNCSFGRTWKPRLRNSNHRLFISNSVNNTISFS